VQCLAECRDSLSDTSNNPYRCCASVSLLRVSEKPSRSASDSLAFVVGLSQSLLMELLAFFWIGSREVLALSGILYFAQLCSDGFTAGSWGVSAFWDLTVPYE